MWRGLKFSKERIIRYTGENILYECNRTFRTRVQAISWQWGRVKLPKDPLSYIQFITCHFNWNISYIYWKDFNTLG